MHASIAACLRDHYVQLQGYVSAGMESDKTEEKLFLNANENPYELPGMESFNRYPEPQPKALAQAYGNVYGVQTDQLVMTRGADEAIVILTKLFCEPHKDAVIICPPTFGMYGVNASAMPCEKVEVPLIKLDTTFALDKDAIIATAKDDSKTVKLIYICTPNNPTANSFDQAEIIDVINAVEGHAIVILDETYAEFADQESLAPRINEFPNLVILRTLSKSYSMAGMRMGCFLCADTDFIALAKAKALDAYPLPKASVEAALHVLSDNIRKIAHDNIKSLIAERKRMEKAFADIPEIRKVFQSDANFVLVEMDNAADFIAFAKSRNVLLRDFSKGDLTKDCIRISVGLPEQNDIVLELLEEFRNQQAA